MTWLVFDINLFFQFSSGFVFILMPRKPANRFLYPDAAFRGRWDKWFVKTRSRMGQVCISERGDGCWDLDTFYVQYQVHNDIIYRWLSEYLQVETKDGFVIRVTNADAPHNYSMATTNTVYQGVIYQLMMQI